MDTFDRILKRVEEIKEKRNGPTTNEQYTAYCTGIWWGLIMALQETDFERWLDWHFEEEFRTNG